MGRDIRSIVLASLALIAIAAFWAMTSGCRDYATQPTPSAWAYDEQWKAVTDCWGYEPKHPVVIVRDDCWVSSHGTMIYAAPYSETGYAAGEYDAPRTVQVCPDLAALEHEMSHYVLDKMTGNSGIHTRGGCFDVGRGA